MIRAARKHLAWLEQQSADATPTPQLDLFAAPPTPEDDEDDFGAAPATVSAPLAPALAPEQAALVDALAGLDPDTLTPRAALEALYRLKALAGEALDAA
ncbi:DNA mismatch repair protein MutS [compost metagenome]